MKIYLAGPDVFRNDAVEFLDGLKELCKQYKFEGIAPLDNVVQVDDKYRYTPTHSSLIFRSNVKLIRECDVVIANIIPFRGVCIDDGTAWEIGFAYALGKKVYGYSEHCNKTLLEITNEFFQYDLIPPAIRGEYGIIEDFKNGVNLMICDSIRDSGGSVCETFEDCLKILTEDRDKEEEFYKNTIENEKNIMEKYLDTFGEDSESGD